MPLSVLKLEELPSREFAGNDRPFVAILLMVFKYESFLFVSNRSFGYSLSQMVMPSMGKELTFLGTVLQSVCGF